MKYKCINTKVFFVFHKFLKINLDTDFKVFQFYSQSEASGVIGTPTIGFFCTRDERRERVCTTPAPHPVLHQHFYHAKSSSPCQCRNRVVQVLQSAKPSLKALLLVSVGLRNRKK